ncbi:wall-associated receptor kinase-like 22 isoform X1 [Juglans regia]|nr:wall-associated receptor kinase-like 22 isoform X1 [Juglans regia]
MGCNNSASMWSFPDDSVSYGGCKSPCDRAPFKNGSLCMRNATNCCQTTIPSNLHAFSTTIEPKNNGSSECNYAFLIDRNWFETKFTEPNPNMSVPVVLEWGIDNTSFYSLPIRKNSTAREFKNSTYSCYRLISRMGDLGTPRCGCENGYSGNPYLLGGCRDVDECEDPRLNHCTNDIARCENTEGYYRCVPPKNKKPFIIIGVSTSLGVLFLIFGGWWSYKAIKKRRRVKRKEKFFKQNGGLLLEQQLSTNNKDNVENTKLFNSKELEKATDRFSKNRIIGHGGQGTIYKGMLADGRIVAIKKSNIIDEEKLQEFINEVVILSQINHRNVVKLLGCCLETEVPLLVYEFIPNGTLAQYLNGQNEEFPPTWDMRLRIALEVAGALFYLHSAASSPIYHRDIKSTNILLDNKYRAKVADFGISRSVAIDQTHLSTLVHGTFGYVDPEYFWSSQFTDKSDVYSFGVVLAELLTGEKAISSSRTRDTKSLAAFFVSSMEGNNLFDILDNRVLKEAEKEKIIAVANLAKRCLNLNGKERPSIREVAIELEANQMSPKAFNLQQKYGEIEDIRTEIYEQDDVVSISTTSGMDSVITTSSLNSQPLLLSS